MIIRMAIHISKIQIWHFNEQLNPIQLNQLLVAIKVWNQSNEYCLGSRLEVVSN
jgi:hypothetical protein